jgi:outer membrane protein OmpA-like peptidoglycan-associated protein
MSSARASAVLVVLVALVAACAHQGTELVQPVGETHTTASSTGGAHPQGVDVPSAPIGVVVAEEVRRSCSLPQQRQRAPSFDVDSARLRPRGDDTLKRLAACILSGKLGDDPITIVGHTDPRGEASYNQQLGLYRAIAAKHYLVDLGVPAGRLSTDSLGAREARGTDEASWALDRTIELRMGPVPGEIPR